MTKKKGRTDTGFHPPLSCGFITNPSRAESTLKRSKLTQRVTEAASAVPGITFHPNGMDGGSDNCHPDLASPHHSHQTRHTLCGGRAETSNIHCVPLSLRKRGHLPAPDVNLRFSSGLLVENLLANVLLLEIGYVFVGKWHTRH